jgi:hypothetical protein
MGMYDNVCIKATCPVCGKKMSDFQTKDTDCTLDYIMPGNYKLTPGSRLHTYSYCDHEWATVCRFEKDKDPDDRVVSHVWMDVEIPVNKDGTLSRDTRKYKVSWKEDTWDMDEMEKAAYPTFRHSPSEMVIEKNKIIKEMRAKGPYKPTVMVDDEGYDAHVKAEMKYYDRIFQEMTEKNKAIVKECVERHIIAECENCVHKKGDRCKIIDDVPGVDMDFSNDLLEKGFCCEWKEKDVKTDW